MKIRNKFFNGKVEYKGLKFDSKAELSRYIELEEMERNGIIRDLEVQPSFLLQDSFKHKSIARKQAKMVYTADFKYTKDNEEYIEEFKSEYTAKLTDYRMRIKMFLFKYPEINFIEVIG